jgi:hypothetical protein
MGQIPVSHLNSQEERLKTITAGSSNNNYMEFTGSGHVVLFNLWDNSGGTALYSIRLDTIIDIAGVASPYVLAALLLGITNTSGDLAEPTGFPASQSYFAHFGNYAAGFTTNSSGDVVSQSLSIADSQVKWVKSVQIGYNAIEATADFTLNMALIVGVE